MNQAIKGFHAHSAKSSDHHCMHKLAVTFSHTLCKSGAGPNHVADVLQRSSYHSRQNSNSQGASTLNLLSECLGLSLNECETSAESIYAGGDISWENDELVCIDVRKLGIGAENVTLLNISSLDGTTSIIPLVFVAGRFEQNYDFLSSIDSYFASGRDQFSTEKILFIEQLRKLAMQKYAFRMGLDDEGFYVSPTCDDF